jgi:Fe-S cluster biogenesis protein NfuA
MFSHSAQSLATKNLFRARPCLSATVNPYAANVWQQLRSIFIQTADTPNPESLNFVPTGVAVLTDNPDGNGFYVTKNDPAKEILRSPLAKSLFDVEGVKAVYLGGDFVTVTKYAEHKWKILRPQLFDVLMNWADSEKPALLEMPEITDTTIMEDDDEIVAMIKELIESRIRPAVQEDGGDIRYVSFEEETGIVTVELAGSCVGCPSSSVTLKQGVENMLMHYIPEVSSVVSLEEEQPEVVNSVKVEESSSSGQQKSYEERLAAAGIPFSD